MISVLHSECRAEKKVLGDKGCVVAFLDDVPCLLCAKAYQLTAC